MVREMMRYHAARFGDPATRVQQAAALLDFLASSVTAKEGPYGQLLDQELELLRRVSGSYLFHEHLEDTNEPVYFHRFVEQAAPAGCSTSARRTSPRWPPTASRTRYARRCAASRRPDPGRAVPRLPPQPHVSADAALPRRRSSSTRQVDPARLHGLHVAAAVRAERASGDDETAVFRGAATRRSRRTIPR